MYWWRRGMLGWRWGVHQADATGLGGGGMHKGHDSAGSQVVPFCVVMVVCSAGQRPWPPAAVWRAHSCTLANMSPCNRCLRCAVCARVWRARPHQCVAGRPNAREGGRAPPLGAWFLLRLPRRLAGAQLRPGTAALQRCPPSRHRAIRGCRWGLAWHTEHNGMVGRPPVLCGGR